ncbi:hypothetical protein DCAR_0311795 [Daucus carota subsp. sativus]|uniref:Uncharacterized protein n=1 Tax=Daucus carota subsp. sativus TaxID=79200 RepID=A0AAF0WMB7_DAUCS|nr:hypothetical protein DCAR_0311795 [Daucus carota subsp. sativus]
MNVLQLFAVLVFFRFAFVHGTTMTTRKHYIVYMGHHSHPNVESVISANHNMLASVIAKKASVHHYTKSFRGFSAMLTPDQAQDLEENDSVVSIFESRTNQVHTTNSWNFLRVDKIKQYNQLPMDLKSDTIVGVIDTGVWPESESFNDHGLGPVPTKFKGECVTGDNFTLSNCNRKIIGARFYYGGIEAVFGPLEKSKRTFFRSARDSDGHGTHLASTVAGSMVENASYYGIGKGTLRGGAPSARLAIYKACWFGICIDADVLSAMDDAIDDGVDIMSLSFGPSPPLRDYFMDPVSIGSFHAFQKGIFVSASAGNGHFPGSVANVAPWIMTVAASSMDRVLQSFIYLGNSKIIKVMFNICSLNNEVKVNLLTERTYIFQGTGVNPPTESTKFYSLIAGSFAAFPGIPPQNASYCKNNTLDPSLVKGKIVICAMESAADARAEKGLFVIQNGGVGIIIIDPAAKSDAFQIQIKAIFIDLEEAKELLAYIAAERNPIARISQTRTLLMTEPAPEIAEFSSRGPNTLTPDIIKPDITAPGINILAAWSPLAIESAGGRSVDYNILSGSSMSCPHVSAVAAIIKSCHPSWSPAAIKSALMTSATSVDNSHDLIGRISSTTHATPFEYGSGHINPVAALDPGLIYDFTITDAVDFLCSNGANSSQLMNLTGEQIYCKNQPIPSYDLNYPSIGVSKMKGSLSIWRKVTYVGKGPSVYVSQLDYPSGVHFTVVPKELKFSTTGEELSYRIDFKAHKSSNGSFVFGALTWSNGIHRVRSPISLNVVSV